MREKSKEREEGKRMCCESADWRIPALLAVAQQRNVGCMNMYIDGILPTFIWIRCTGKCHQDLFEKFEKLSYWRKVHLSRYSSDIETHHTVT